MSLWNRENGDAFTSCLLRDFRGDDRRARGGNDAVQAGSLLQRLRRAWSIKATASQLNEQLAQFERDTSTQIVVAIYRTMQSESSVADYTQRIAQTWGVGQKGRNNGAVLFVFVENRQMFIQTGYGLEGALPDATCFDITHNVIAPLFKKGDYTGGLKAGVTAMMQAVRGEYKGTGAPARKRKSGSGSGSPIGLIIFLLIVIFFIIVEPSGATRTARLRL